MGSRHAWSPEKIVEEIRQLRASGISPSQKYVVSSYPALYGAGSRYFGSWRKALEAAGETPQKVTRESLITASQSRTRWTKEAIIAALQERHAGGHLLNVSALRKAGLAGLHKAARDRFGSYQAAVEAAGLDYTDIRAIRSLKDCAGDPSKIVQMILDWKEKGCDLNVSAMQFHDSSLVTLAYKIFGSWDEALKQAGLDPRQIRLDVNTESHKGRIFQNICHELFATLRPNWHRSYRFTRGEFTAYPDLHDEDDDTWIDFKLAAFGESVNTSIRKYSPYAPRLLFIHLDGRRSPFSKVEFRSVFSFEQENSSTAVRTLFEELRGLRNYNPPGTSLERWARKWTKADIIRFLQDLPRAELSSRHAQLEHKAEYKAAYRLFGGWYEAVKAAGVNPADVRRQAPVYRRDDIDLFIRGRLDRGEPLNAKSVCSFPDGNGKYQAAGRLYGSWEEALRVNGLRYKEVKAKPGREKVTKEILDEFIRQRKRRGEPLNAQAVRDHYKGEYGAADRIYGGWRKAVEANGIAYQDVSVLRVQARIEKDDLDEFIQLRWKSGQPLNAKAVCAGNRPMYTAACRNYYGSWRQALESNGIRYEAVSLKRPRR